MLRVNNKVISFARGENIAFSVEIRDADGVPFIFPVSAGTYAKELVFKAIDEYGNSVIEKSMDITKNIVYLNADGESVIDYSSQGYAKFSTQVISNVSDVNTFYGYSKTATGNGVTGSNEQIVNRKKVAKVGNNYYCWCSNTSEATSDNGQPVIYKFNFANRRIVVGMYKNLE